LLIDLTITNKIQKKSNIQVIFCIAFLGQKFMHCPHSTHNPWSIVGNSKPFWLIAPTGHTAIEGQR